MRLPPFGNVYPLELFSPRIHSFLGAGPFPSVSQSVSQSSSGILSTGPPELPPRRETNMCLLFRLSNIRCGSCFSLSLLLPTPRHGATGSLVASPLAKSGPSPGPKMTSCENHCISQLRSLLCPELCLRWQLLPLPQFHML